MNARLWFLLACLVLGVALPVRAVVRALVVGIDEYPGGDRLPSCVNDACGMTNLLTKQFGVPKDNVRLLLNSDASADGVRKAFKEHLLDTTRPGDEALFFFSGHGALFPNWTGTGGSRLIKVLVTHQKSATGFTNVFTHAELKTLLGHLQTTNITVILDCCFAGSMTKALRSPAPEQKAKVMNIGFGAAEIYLGQEPREPTQIFSKKVSANIPVLWLGACLSNQVSYCGRPMSRFTGALIEQFQQQHNQPVAKAFSQVQAKVERETRTIPGGVQTPILEGPAERPLVRTGTGPTVSEDTQPSSVVVTPPRDEAPPSGQQFPLFVQIDRTQYTEGDEMKVRVTAGADCYLRLYVMNAATETKQLFPNEYATDNFIHKNQIIEIPVPDTFVLRMTKPFGTETLLAVGSLKQFTDLFRPSYGAGGFQDVGNMFPSRIGTRGIVVEPANKISYSSVQYTVSPRP